MTTVRLGRRIYDNLRKAMSFILAVHVPIVGLALMPLVFEAEREEDGVMNRPPRRPAFTSSSAG